MQTKRELLSAEKNATNMTIKKHHIKSSSYIITPFFVVCFSFHCYIDTLLDCSHHHLTQSWYDEPILGNLSLYYSFSLLPEENKTFFFKLNDHNVTYLRVDGVYMRAHFSDLLFSNVRLAK